jgi:hypothetical protein
MVHLGRHLVDILLAVAAAVWRVINQTDKLKLDTQEEQVAVVKDIIMVLQKTQQRTLAVAAVEVHLTALQLVMVAQV